jgi:hypothetical protein
MDSAYVDFFTLNEILPSAKDDDPSLNNFLPPDFYFQKPKKSLPVKNFVFIPRPSL